MRSPSTPPLSSAARWRCPGPYYAYSPDPDPNHDYGFQGYATECVTYVGEPASFSHRAGLLEVGCYSDDLEFGEDPATWFVVNCYWIGVTPLLVPAGSAVCRRAGPVVGPRSLYPPRRTTAGIEFADETNSGGCF